MGITKTDLFTEEQNQLADFARVMGHPARIAILECLIKANACVNGELVNEVGLAQATVSQHLKELKESGLISGSVQGTSMSYCINPKKWNEVKITLNRFFERFNLPNIDCC